MRPELGELTFWGALLLPAMYVANHGVRRVNRWSGRRPPPRESVGFFVMFYTLVGAVVGSLCQPMWTRSAGCTHDRRGLLGCFFDDVAAPPIRAIEREVERVHVPALERDPARAREPELERDVEREPGPRTVDREPARARDLDPEQRTLERAPTRGSEPEERTLDRAPSHVREPELERRPEPARAPLPRTTSERQPPTGNP
jgi:hypothetical protein